MKMLAMAAAMAAGGAAAQTAETIRLAGDLAAVLAAEEPCGLSYDPAAVAAWLDDRVDAADMSFAPTLATMTAGATHTLDRMTDTQRAAHCAQTRRVARSLGFIAGE